MSRNGSGTYTLPANSFSNPVSGTQIDAEDADETLTDIETALTASIAKDGQTVATSAIPFAAGIQVDTISEKTTAAGVTIDSVLLKDGGATLTAPLIISGASAGQIVFPASQNASANANTLDDYEEGTFTPALTFGAAAVGMTFTSRNGYYTKVGDRVWFEVYFVLSAKGSSTGSALFTALPFTQSSATNSNAGVAIHFEVMSTMAGHADAYVVGNSTTISPGQLGTGTWAALTHANFNDTSQVGLAGQYRV